jgi:hypothetical protein
MQATKTYVAASRRSGPVLDSWDDSSIEDSARSSACDSELSDGNVKNTSYGIDLETWASLRQGRWPTDYLGRGYGAKISQYADARERGSTAAYLSGGAKTLSHRERRRLRREFRQACDEEESYLVFEAFKPNASAKSLVMSRAHYSAVDSGTQLTIVRKGGIKFEGFDPKAAVKIMGFDGSITKSLGSANIVGFIKTRQGRIIPLRIPNAQVVPSAPSDLIYVSALVAAGYSFHFTPEGSWIVTPEMEILDLVEKSGLYWLKWYKAVDPARCSVADEVSAGADNEEPVQRSSAAEVSYVEDEEDELPVDEGRLELNRVEGHESAPFDFVGCNHRECVSCNLAARARGQAVPLSLLHQRLGHYSEDMIIKMVDNNL